MTRTRRVSSAKACLRSSSGNSSLANASSSLTASHASVAAESGAARNPLPQFVSYDQRRNRYVAYLPRSKGVRGAKGRGQKKLGLFSSSEEAHLAVQVALRRLDSGREDGAKELEAPSPPLADADGGNELVTGVNSIGIADKAEPMEEDEGLHATETTTTEDKAEPMEEDEGVHATETTATEQNVASQVHAQVCLSLSLHRSTVFRIVRVPCTTYSCGTSLSSCSLAWPDVGSSLCFCSPISVSSHCILLQHAFLMSTRLLTLALHHDALLVRHQLLWGLVVFSSILPFSSHLTSQLVIGSWCSAESDRSSALQAAALVLDGDFRGECWQST